MESSMAVVSINKSRGLSSYSYKGELYLYIQFKDHLNRVNLDKLERRQYPELELVADYRTEGLPLGMCPFLEISGKKYMVGGEKTRKIPEVEDGWGERTQEIPNAKYQLDWEVFEPSGALNSHVFVLDPFDGKITIDRSFPKANAAKTKAKVLATIDQKVYVLGTRAYYYWGVLPDPAFECFDIVENRWEPLPAPPDYYDPPKSVQSAVTKYYYHFVFGRGIYLYTLGGLFSFNVDTPTEGWKWVGDSKWRLDLDFFPYHSDGEEEVESEPEDDDSMPLTPAHPYHSICFAEPGKGGLAVGYTAEGLVGYVFDCDGNMLFQRLLDSHNSCLPSPCQMMFGGKVLHVDGDKFCLILSGKIEIPSWSLAVATFKLTISMLIFDGLYSGCVDLSYYKFYDIDSEYANEHLYEEDYKFPVLYDYRNLQDAFFMYVKSKIEPKGKSKHGQATWPGGRTRRRGEDEDEDEAEDEDGGDGTERDRSHCWSHWHGFY